jgi:hypothetical protein
VTPELVQAFTHVEALWQPEVKTPTVRQGNWLDMDDIYGRYSAIIGDWKIGISTGIFN